MTSQNTQLSQISNYTIFYRLSSVPSSIRNGNTNWRAELESFNAQHGTNWDTVLFMELARTAVKVAKGVGGLLEVRFEDLRLRGLVMCELGCEGCEECGGEKVVVDILLDG
jgi:hypothetical protein